MARTTLEDRVALILGADNNVGRSAALQLSRSKARVILAGTRREPINSLAQFLLSKKGDPTEVMLKATHEERIEQIRKAREAAGHIHFVVNAFACSPEEDTERSLALQAELAEQIMGRGHSRFLLLWPAETEVPRLTRRGWQSIVRVEGLAAAAVAPGPGEPSPTMPGLKPAAIADVVVFLLQCPLSACPVEVTLRAPDA